MRTIVVYKFSCLIYRLDGQVGQPTAKPLKVNTLHHSANWKNTYKNVKPED